MPPITVTMVSQSSRVARSPSSHAPSSATQIGAEYWIRIALAAVVSLLARMNSPVVAASEYGPRYSAAAIRANDGRHHSHSAVAAIALRVDQIAPAFQSTSLISTPALLHSAAHSASRATAWR